MKRFVVLIALMALFMGCMTLTVDAPMVKSPISLSSQTGNVGTTPSKHFVRKGRAFYALWGLVPISIPETGRWFQEELQMGEGTAIKNVKVSTYFDPIDFLVSLFLGGLTIASKSVEIEGDVIK